MSSKLRGNKEDLHFRQNFYDSDTQSKSRRINWWSWRRRCRIIPQKLRKFDKRSLSRKRGRLGKIIADIECCIYSRQKWRKGIYEKLSKCVTENTAETLKLFAVQKNYNLRLLAYVAGMDWQFIVAIGLQYHPSCYVHTTTECQWKTLGCFL